MKPAEGEYYRGDIFIINVRIDTERECVNTIEANLSFSQDVLEAVDFSEGSSIISIWAKAPDLSNETGLISFAGGIPGGFCGILLGDPGESNLLGKIIFKVKEVDREQTPTKIEFLDSSQVLLNDGFGTPAELTTRGAVFAILPGISETPKEEWQEELERDRIPPEPFVIEVHQNPTIFEGKYFVIFSTTDKQTGVDYYEVKEGKKDWKKTESPYLLEDQSLKGIIKVKAVDKTGNEQIAEYPPQKILQPLLYRTIIIIIIIILISVGAIVWLWRKRRKYF